MSTTKQKTVVTIESVAICWHLPHCKYFKKDKCQMVKRLSVHTLTKEESIYQSKRKSKGNRVRERKDNGCNCEFLQITSPRTSSGELWQLETSMNTHLKAKGNLGQVGQSKMPIKVILAPKNETSAREESVSSSHQSLERANFRDKFPSLNVIQTSSKNGRSPTAPPHDQKVDRLE